MLRLPRWVVQVQQRHPVDDGPGHLADVVALRGFDLDDIGAHVGQECGEESGAEQRALDDSNAGEGRIGVTHDCMPPSTRRTMPLQ